MSWLAAGAGLLGGILQDRSNSKAARKQYKYDRRAMLLQNDMNKNAEKRQYGWNKLTEQERFKWLVKGAESAGFNPLTVLGATGGAMGNSPNASAPSAAVQQAPLSNIGQTLAQAGENFARFYVDPVEKATQHLQAELLQKQIDQIDRENLRFGSGVLKTTASPTRYRGDTEDTQDVPLYQRHNAEGGTSVSPPVGPDFSEMMSGFALDLAAKSKKKAPFRRGRDAFRAQEYRNRVTIPLQRIHENKGKPNWVR